MKSLGPRQLYRGVAEIRQEGFEAALQRFRDESQQTASRMRLRAELDDEGIVSIAAGLVVERLPGMAPEAFSDIFDAVLEGDFRALMTSFAFGQLAGAGVEVLGSWDFVYQCSCSRERVLATLRALGAAEIESLIAEQGGGEVTCHFCNEVYRVDSDGLRALVA